MRNLLSIDLIPFWQGITRGPQEPTCLPFSLAWDPAGYCRQTTSPLVLNRVVNRYNEEDYTYLTAPPGASAWANSRGKIQQNFVEEFSKSGGEILEIGAGSTYLAKQLISTLKPRRYIIIDPAIAEEGDDGVEIVKSYFPFPDKTVIPKFDTVISFSSLEHADNPIFFLQGIADLLKPDGKGLICIPDVTNTFNRGDLNELMHEHITYLTPDTFKHVAACAGLSVQYLRLSDDLLWGVVSPSRREQKLMSLPDIFRDMERRFISPAGQKAELIKNVLGLGKNIGFHGATNGLCNFLYLSGLSGEKNLYIFDSDESKHGFYLPGNPNPIGSPYDPQYSKMDIMYVSAMAFYEIISRFAQSNSTLNSNRIRPLFE